jgi:hypothetical protein
MPQVDWDTELRSQIKVVRGDICRAKDAILKSGHETVDSILKDWLNAQNINEKDTVNTDSAECSRDISEIAKYVSLRFAFYQAVWELITSGDLYPGEPPNYWDCSFTNRHSHGAESLLKGPLRVWRIPSVQRPFAPQSFSADTDVFLAGIGSARMHDGIVEGIELALVCFQRGLYMPSTVMLAAAVEAEWIECGTAVATKLGSTSLQKKITDECPIGRLIPAIQKTLESAGTAILSDAGETIATLTEVVTWTNVLRDRRNYLHWGKAKSFVADHSSTASLMLGAPLFLKTLVNIRLACI